jgi:hypothetical protein
MGKRRRNPELVQMNFYRKTLLRVREFPAPTTFWRSTCLYISRRLGLRPSIAASASLSRRWQQSSFGVHVLFPLHAEIVTPIVHRGYFQWPAIPLLVTGVPNRHSLPGISFIGLIHTVLVTIVKRVKYKILARPFLPVLALRQIPTPG